AGTIPRSGMGGSRITVARLRQGRTSCRSSSTASWPTPPAFTTASRSHRTRRAEELSLLGAFSFSGWVPEPLGHSPSLEKFNADDADLNGNATDETARTLV